MMGAYKVPLYHVLRSDLSLQGKGVVHSSPPETKSWLGREKVGDQCVVAISSTRRSIMPHWYFARTRWKPSAAILSRRGLSRRRSRHASVKLDGESVTNKCFHDSRSSPSAPTLVETTALPCAIASRILIRVPPPKRIGTTTRVAFSK